METKLDAAEPKKAVRDPGPPPHLYFQLNRVMTDEARPEQGWDDPSDGYLRQESAHGGSHLLGLLFCGEIVAAKTPGYLISNIIESIDSF
jgi:hypothetical protein